jgi:ribosome recycling factor
MIAKLPESIQEECRDFVLNYKEEDLDLLKKYNHDKTWKEDEEELKKITTDILNVV